MKRHKRDLRDAGLIPGSGRSPGGGHGNTLQYSCLENSHGQRSLMGYSLWGHHRSVLACMHIQALRIVTGDITVSSMTIHTVWSHSVLAEAMNLVWYLFHRWEHGSSGKWDGVSRLQHQDLWVCVPDVTPRTWAIPQLCHTSGQGPTESRAGWARGPSLFSRCSQPGPGLANSVSTLIMILL